MLAIPIVGEATQITSGATSYFAQPIDAILFDILIWFGWIPIAITLVWGFILVWLSFNQGKYVRSLKYIMLAIDVPSMTEQTPKALENLFALLYGCKSAITFKEKWMYGRLHPVFSFEIVSTEGYIQFLIRTQTRFRDVIEAGIYAHYPDAEISEVEDYTDALPKDFPNETHEMWGGELTFDKPSMYPIRTYVDFEDRLTQEIKDPLGYTLEQLAKMRPGEHFWIQILVQPSKNSWKDAGIKHVKEIYGQVEKEKKGLITSVAESVLTVPSELLMHATDVDLSGLLLGEGEAREEDQWKVFKLSPPEIEESKAIIQKATKVGHGVKIRILYLAKKNAFVKVERTSMVKGILGQYAHLNFNRFGLHIPSVPKDDYFWMRMVYTKKQRTLMNAYCYRSWGIGATPIWMNSEELATLWHFPTIAIKAPLIKKAEAKRAEPPVGLPITDLEDTLPGFVPSGANQEEYKGGIATADSSSGEPPMGLPMGDVIDEPLVFEEGVIPDVKAPTDVESVEKLKHDDESIVPPNLPV